LRIAQLERRVRQVLDVVFLDEVILAADVLARRHHAAPDLRQFRQHAAVAVLLRGGGWRHADSGWARPGKSANRLLKLRFSR
jgi:hypothetical protein